MSPAAVGQPSFGSHNNKVIIFVLYWSLLHEGVFILALVKNTPPISLHSSITVAQQTLLYIPSTRSVYLSVRLSASVFSSYTEGSKQEPECACSGVQFKYTLLQIFLKTLLFR